MDLSSSLSTILGLFLSCVQMLCKRLLRHVISKADNKMDQNERLLFVAEAVEEHAWHPYTHITLDFDLVLTFRHGIKTNGDRGRLGHV
uniref:Uncharacterized protein n=1 Tax=Oryza nivara TaxID=4536 RepID=A0A0E0J3D5_ORYNI